VCSAHDRLCRLTYVRGFLTGLKTCRAECVFFKFCRDAQTANHQPPTTPRRRGIACRWAYGRHRMAAGQRPSPGPVLESIGGTALREAEDADAYRRRLALARFPADTVPMHAAWGAPRAIAARAARLSAARHPAVAPPSRRRRADGGAIVRGRSGRRTAFVGTRVESRDGRARVLPPPAGCRTAG
jgi:hypothetical protein